MYNNTLLFVALRRRHSKLSLSAENDVPLWRKERYFFLALEYYFKAISFDVSDWI